MVEQKYKEQRSEPRIPIKPLHHISFEWRHQGRVHSLEISNVSRKGIGFLKSDRVPLPSSGVIEGVLAVAGQKFEVHPEIVFSNDRATGCRLTDSREEIDRAIEEYFSVELTALQLIRPSESRYSCEDHQILEVWEGQNNCEVLLLLEGDSLVRFKITFFGNVFDGGETRLLTVGEIIHGNDFDDFSAGGRMVLTKPVGELDSTTKEAALRFVNTLEEVREPHRRVIADAIQAFPVA